MTGCSYKITKNTDNDKDATPNDALQKKQMCSSYKEKIVLEIEKDFPDAVLEEIFYSPSQQSCMYILNNTYASNGAELVIYHDFILKDYFTNKILFYNNSTCKGLYTLCLEKFENQIIQYRK